MEPTAIIRLKISFVVDSHDQKLGSLPTQAAVAAGHCAIDMGKH